MKRDLKFYLAVLIGFAVLVLFSGLICHVFDVRVHFLTGEISIQNRTSFEYWGIYWNDHRPYIYHNSKYYVQYELNTNGSLGWKFNKDAIGK